MSIESSSSDVSSPTWREIERFVEEVEQSARSCPSRAEFYQVLLARSAKALAAASGRLWAIQGGRPNIVAEFENDPLPDAAAERLERVRLPHVRPTFNADGPHIAEFDGAAPLDAFRLVTFPLKRGHETLGLIELVIRATSADTVESHLHQVLTAMGAIAEDFYRNEELRALQSDAGFAAEFRSFATSIHRSLDLREVAFEIANEARRMLGVDRVSVLQNRGGRWRVIAISNLAAVDRRNRTISEMERFVTAVAAIGTRLWHGAGRTELPELDEHLSLFLDQSSSRIVGVIPLTTRSATNPDEDTPVRGAIVIENFTAEAGETLPEKAEVLAAQAGLALRNAIEHSDLPFGTLVRLAQRFRSLLDRQRLPKTIAVLTGIAICIVALVFIRVDFTIEAEGQLEPALSRNIYAPLDGDITEVHVQHDAAVSAGDTLLVIRSVELDLEFRRLSGERAATQERLLAVESERIARRTGEDRMPKASTMTEEELRHRLASFDEQLSIVTKQRDALRLQSPIQGRILTWEADELLAARPVRRGQALLRVADVEGEWLLKLRVSDHESGYVLNAMRDASQPLRVEFSLATEPGASYFGTVDQTAQITSQDAQGNSVVEVRVRIDDPSNVMEMRPGADAIGKIHCGQRSIGFVWLRDLFEFVQAKILF